MEITSVHIPQNGFYTLYAEGNLLKITEESEGFCAQFAGESIIILYYTFPFHRRLYVTCSTEKWSGFVHSFSDLDSPLSVLAQLRGRSFDEFKRTADYLNHLTDSGFYTYPIKFFFQLVCLVREKKNMPQNIRALVSLYDPERLLPEKIAWKH
jgi:hypothetical protein